MQIDDGWPYKLGKIIAAMRTLTREARDVYAGPSARRHPSALPRRRPSGGVK